MIRLVSLYLNYPANYGLARDGFYQVFCSVCPERYLIPEYCWRNHFFYLIWEKFKKDDEEIYGRFIFSDFWGVAGDGV